MSDILLFINSNSKLLIKLLLMCFLIGYIFGSIPVAYLYSKAHGVNILEYGSGNPGSTNVGRALGKGHGRVVFVLDILKIVVPVVIICAIFFISNSKLLYGSDITTKSLIKIYGDYIAIYTGLGGILGHNFPIFLHFKGGKGISCTMGAMFCFSILYSLILFLVYKITTKITQYVSAGSITALTILFISSIILAFNNLYPFNYDNNIHYGIILLPGIFVIWIMGVIRHRDNIMRLINHTESKIE